MGAGARHFMVSGYPPPPLYIWVNWLVFSHLCISRPFRNPLKTNGLEGED